MQRGAEFSANRFTNMGFHYKFRLRKNKTTEGYIKIHSHGLQRPRHPSIPKGNSKFKSYLKKYLV